MGGVPGAGVGAALHLDEGRAAILVEQQVIDRPAPAALGLVGDSRFSADQQPAERSLGAELAAREQVGVLREQPLEQVLRVVVGAGERLDRVSILKKDRIFSVHAYSWSGVASHNRSGSALV